MRSLLLAVAVAGCAGHAPPTSWPGRAPAVAPARDLAAARRAAPAGARGAQTAAKDPRVVDLDIIRITARQTGPGGDVELDHVATTDLFERANEAAKQGQPDRALSIYRRLVTDFPASRFAPVALFDMAAIYDRRGDLTATIATLGELVRAYPSSRESVEGQLYIAALQAEHGRFADAVTTLDAALSRANLTYADRIEAFARKGYALVELHRYPEASAALDGAISAWHQVPRLEDPYYIAMAFYYEGELAHRKFLEAPIRLAAPGAHAPPPPPADARSTTASLDPQLYADLQAKRALAVQAYDRWKACLAFKQAYWATAAGYQMSQIFVELWAATVRAPYPTALAPAAKAAYIQELHERMREHLEKALEGHRMNVELAKAYGVETSWSRGSAIQATRVMELLAQDTAGQYVTPETPPPAGPMAGISPTSPHI